MKKLFFVLIALLFLLGGCVQQQAPIVPTEYEQIALSVTKMEVPEGETNCNFLSAELNKQLLEAGYDSRIVQGSLWEFDCEKDLSIPFKCYNGEHLWVELNLNGEKIWIESTNGLVIPDNLKQYYQVANT